MKTATRDGATGAVDLNADRHPPSARRTGQPHHGPEAGLSGDRSEWRILNDQTEFDSAFVVSAEQRRKCGLLFAQGIVNQGEITLAMGN